MDNGTYDWTDPQSHYRHFLFSEVCEDKPEQVLALVEKCLKQLGNVTGYAAFLRYPLTIERDIDVASVRMRLAIDLHSRDKNYEYMPAVAFGLAKEEA